MTELHGADAPAAAEAAENEEETELFDRLVASAMSQEQLAA